MIKQKKIKIEFLDTANVDKDFYPIPSRKALPEWYKKKEAFYGGKRLIIPENNLTATIKRCVPVLDMITAGYIIPSPVDVFVTQVDGMPYFNWKSLNAIDFHGLPQIEGHPYYNMKNGESVPKWNNPWGIRTPTGYSCLFITPTHRENQFFKIFEGIVDTDSYNLPVQFPFVLNDPSFEGLIPAGTPIAQVIPFRRESFVYEASFPEVDNELERQNKLFLTHYFDLYRNKFWFTKNYD